jgi:succinate-acetate transporter protein
MSSTSEALGDSGPDAESTDRALVAALRRGAGSFFPSTPSGQPVALAGFGVSLGLVSLVNIEAFSPSAGLIIAPAAFSFGFVGLILAGMWDYRAGDMFSATWDVAYGCFWLFLGLWLTVFGPQVTEAAGPAGASDAFGAYMFIWALFTLYMTFGAYYIARPPFLAFALLFLVFLGTGISSISAPSEFSDTMRHITGVVGLADAAVALYVGFALVLNEMSRRNVVPLWPYPHPEED